MLLQLHDCSTGQLAGSRAVTFEDTVDRLQRVPGDRSCLLRRGARPRTGVSQRCHAGHRRCGTGCRPLWPHTPTPLRNLFGLPRHAARIGQDDRSPAPDSDRQSVQTALHWDDTRFPGAFLHSYAGAIKPTQACGPRQAYDMPIAQEAQEAFDNLILPLGLPMHSQNMAY